MATFEVSSVGALAKLIEKHAKTREKKVVKAIVRAAHVAADTNSSALKRNIPVAHGELRESVHVEGMSVVVDAPHAAAVNNGSRPHWPPLEPILEWVKLRGMQGLTTDRQRSRLPGTTTAAHAVSVASMLRAQERGGALPIDAAEQVARAIQRAIGLHGTKPAHFVEKSLPEMFRVLDREIRKALGESPDGSDGPEGAPKPKSTFARPRDSRGRFLPTKS